MKIAGYWIGSAALGFGQTMAAITAGLVARYGITANGFPDHEHGALLLIGANLMIAGGLSTIFKAQDLP